MNKTTTYIVAGLLPCLIGDPILGVACPQVSGTPKVAILESPFQTEALGLASGVIATHQPGDFASQFLELTASQTSLEPSPPGDVLKIETREGRNALELEVEDIIGTLQDVEDMGVGMASRMVERLSGIPLAEWDLTEWEQNIVDILYDHDFDHPMVILAAVRDSKLYIVQREIIGRIHPAYDRAILRLREADPFYTLDEKGHQRFVDFMDSQVEAVVRQYAFGDLRNFRLTREILQVAQNRIQDDAVRTFLATLRSAA